VYYVRMYGVCWRFVVSVVLGVLIVVCCGIVGCWLV